MRNIALLILLFWIFSLFVSCTKIVEAPVVPDENTSFSGNTEVVWQEIINQIGTITQEVEWTPEWITNTPEAKTPPIAIPENPWIRK